MLKSTLKKGIDSYYIPCLLYSVWNKILISLKSILWTKCDVSARWESACLASHTSSLSNRLTIHTKSSFNIGASLGFNWATKAQVCYVVMSKVPWSFFWSHVALVSELRHPCFLSPRILAFDSTIRLNYVHIELYSLVSWSINCKNCKYSPFSKGYLYLR